VAAVELSFLLGLVTLGVATVYEGARSADLIVSEFGLVAPLVGVGAALAAAAASVVWLVRYLERRGLQVFGWYRLGVAAVTAGLIVFGPLG
jgi:undecaprenyl-diphosphatase